MKVLAGCSIQGACIFAPQLSFMAKSLMLLHVFCKHRDRQADDLYLFRLTMICRKCLLIRNSTMHLASGVLLLL